MADSPRPVSYSELDCFRQCPMKWDLGYRQGWKPTTEKRAFALGHLWHSIMEAHYTVIQDFQKNGLGMQVLGEGLGTGRSPRRGTVTETELLERCAKAVGEQVLDTIDDAATHNLMVWAYMGYVEMYGADRDWIILAIEQRGQVALTDDGRELVYVIDLVVEDIDYGGIWIVDHKFPGDLATDTEIDLDDQLGLYWYAWTLAGGAWAHLVNGAMLNEARKKQNVGDKVPREYFKNGKPKGVPQTLDQRFRRTRTNRTAAELTIIADDARKVVKAMELMEANDALYSSPNPGQCAWKCDFKEIHILSRSGAIPVTEILEDFDFTNRAQRLAAEES